LRVELPCRGRSDRESSWKPWNWNSQTALTCPGGGPFHRLQDRRCGEAAMGEQPCKAKGGSPRVPGGRHRSPANGGFGNCSGDDTGAAAGEQLTDKKAKKPGQRKERGGRGSGITKKLAAQANAAQSVMEDAGMDFTSGGSSVPNPVPSVAPANASGARRGRQGRPAGSVAAQRKEGAGSTSIGGSSASSTHLARARGDVKAQSLSLVARCSAS
jgi:hypothetical protein